MKKRLIILLALCLLLCACQKQDGAPESADKLPTVISQAEYVEYQNLFFNKQADAFVGQHVTKTGTLVLLEDNWSNVTRYYVWGYYDQTKCCDWQWEFVPKDPDDLPPAGSLVEMTGTLEHDEAALDKYWYTGAEVSVKTRYAGESCDVDLSLMDGTLERVQLLNLLHTPERYNGKTVRLYGRVQTTTSIQHPYYDNVWSLQFTTDGAVPATGVCVMVTGTWQDGVLTNATVAETKDY